MPERAPLPEILAELNDLLQLDHDAIDAYTIAIEQLQELKLKEALTGFRTDHERHVVALTQLTQPGGRVIRTIRVPQAASPGR